MSLLYNYVDPILGVPVQAFNANIVYGTFNSSMTNTTITINDLSGNKNMIDISNNGLLCKREGVYKMLITFSFSSAIASGNIITFYIAETKGTPLNTDLLPVYASQDVALELITHQYILSLGYLYSTGTANLGYTFATSAGIDSKYNVLTTTIPSNGSNTNGLSVIEAILYLKKNEKPIYFTVLSSPIISTSIRILGNYIIESMLFTGQDITIIDDNVLNNMSYTGIKKYGIYSYIEFYCTSPYLSDAIASIKFNRTNTPLYYILIGGGGGGGDGNGATSDGTSGSGGGGGGVVFSNISSSFIDSYISYIPIMSTEKIFIQVGRGVLNGIKGGDSYIKKGATIAASNNVATSLGGHAGITQSSLSTNLVPGSNVVSNTNDTNNPPTTGGKGTTGTSTAPGNGANGYNISPFGINYLSSGAGGGGDIASSTIKTGGFGGSNSTGGNGGWVGVSGSNQTAGSNGTGYGTGGGGGGASTKTIALGPLVFDIGGYGSPGLVVLFWPT